MTRDEYFNALDKSKHLEHFGIKGQKHGRRRWQNEDGSLTPAGREHYGVGEPRDGSDDELSKLEEFNKSAKYHSEFEEYDRVEKSADREQQAKHDRMVKMGATVVGAALAIYGLKKLSDYRASQRTVEAVNDAVQAVKDARPHFTNVNGKNHTTAADALNRFNGKKSSIMSDLVKSANRTPVSKVANMDLSGLSSRSPNGKGPISKIAGMNLSNYKSSPSTVRGISRMDLSKISRPTASGSGSISRIARTNLSRYKPDPKTVGAISRLNLAKYKR